MDDRMIECEGVGPSLFSDREDRVFYGSCKTCDLQVTVGDCVRVRLEADDDDPNEDSEIIKKQATTNDESLKSNSVNQTAIGQVLAIFEDTSCGEIFVEVRWFFEKHELSTVNLKR